MNYSAEEIFKLNMDREKEHTGQSFVCEKCGCCGAVGKDLVAAATTTTQGSAWSWWVHEACVKQYMEKYRQ